MSERVIAVLAEAAKALVEQVRIANLVALANSHHPVLVGKVATDAADALTEWHSHDDSALGGWSELRPEVAAALGVGKEQDA
jgi:hypothetical protein